MCNSKYSSCCNGVINSDRKNFDIQTYALKYKICEGIKLNILQLLRIRRNYSVSISGISIMVLIISFIFMIDDIYGRLKKHQYKFVTARVVSLNGLPDDGQEATGREMTVEYEDDDCLCSMTVVRQHTYKVGDLLPLLVNKKTGEITDDNVLTRGGFKSKFDNIVFAVIGIAIFAMLVFTGQYDKSLPTEALRYLLSFTLSGTGVCLFLTAFFGMGGIIYDKMTYTVRTEGTVLRGETKEIKRVYRRLGSRRYDSYNVRRFYMVYMYKYGGKTYVTKDYDGTFSIMTGNRQLININMKNGKMIRRSTIAKEIVRYIVFLALSVLLFWLTIFIANDQSAIDIIRKL